MNGWLEFTHRAPGSDIPRSSQVRQIPPLIWVATDRIHEVVVADASPLVRRAMERLLTPDYVVHAVAEGSKVLAIMERRPDALLLTALALDPMDGRTLLRTIEQRWPDRLRNVLVLTGEPEPHRGLPKGVTVLRKPALPDEILAELAARSKANRRRGSPGDVR